MTESSTINSANGIVTIALIAYTTILFMRERYSGATDAGGMKGEKMDDLISRKAVIQMFNSADRYVADSLRICDTDKQFPQNEVFIVDDMYEGLEQLPSAEPRWIPVTERLPEKEKRHYWVCTDTGYQCQCRWTNDVYGLGASDRWEWKIFDIPQYQKVVAWMPLPDPWKGEDDGNN